MAFGGAQKNCPRATKGAKGARMYEPRDYAVVLHTTLNHSNCIRKLYGQFIIFSHLLMSEIFWKKVVEGSSRLEMNTGLEQKSTAMEGLAAPNPGYTYYQVANHTFQELSRI